MVIYIKLFERDRIRMSEGESKEKPKRKRDAIEEENQELKKKVKVLEELDKLQKEVLTGRLKELKELMEQFERIRVLCGGCSDVFKGYLICTGCERCLDNCCICKDKENTKNQIGHQNNSKNGQPFHGLKENRINLYNSCKIFYIRIFLLLVGVKTTPGCSYSNSPSIFSVSWIKARITRETTPKEKDTNGVLYKIRKIQIKQQNTNIVTSIIIRM